MLTNSYPADYRYAPKCAHLTEFPFVHQQKMNRHAVLLLTRKEKVMGIVSDHAGSNPMQARSSLAPCTREKPRARARRTDPSTSHDAAHETEASGRAASQRATCLEEVKRRPGQTAAEIAGFAGLERHVPSRRLPELRDARLVENHEVRPCRVTGSNSMTWYAAEGPPLHVQDNHVDDLAESG